MIIFIIINHVSMMYRFQIQKYILSEVFRVHEPQEPLTFEPYLHVGMTFKNFTHFLNKKVSSRPYTTTVTRRSSHFFFFY